MFEGRVFIAMTLQGLLGWLIVALVMWLLGYIDSDKEQIELILPDSVKMFFGKRGKSLFLRGAFLQILGLVTALSYVTKYLAVKQGQEIIISPGTIFIVTIFIVGIPGSIAIVQRHWRKKGNK